MIVHFVIALSLIGAGWMAARAQSPLRPPDFEIVVNAPVGKTTIDCVRGCTVMWVERGINPNARPQQSFSFECAGDVLRCSSAKVGGWIATP